MRTNGEFDPRVLSDDDLDMGGYIPTPDDPATPGPDHPNRTNKALSQKRLVGGVRDRITQGQIKARIAALYRAGTLYVDMCKQINYDFGLEGTKNAITTHTVSYHVREMLNYWREKSLMHMDEKQAMVLYRYDQIEQLASEAWFQSTQGKTTRNYEKQIERATSKPRKDEIKKEIIEERNGVEGVAPFTNGELDNIIKVTAEKIKEYTRHEESPGDPRFLSIMVDINYKRSQLWNLLNKGEQSTSDQELARLSDDARTERIAAVIAQAKARATGDTGNLAPATPLGGFKEGEEPAPDLKANPPEPTDPIPVTLASSGPLQEEIKGVDLDDLEWE